MYGLTTRLLRSIASSYNVADQQPNFRLEIYKKNGEGGFHQVPYILDDLVLNISLDRRFDMTADELTFDIINKDGVYSPSYSHDRNFEGVYSNKLNGFAGIIESFNLVKCYLGYGEDLLLMFTGQIMNFTIQEENFTMSISCLNLYRKLLTPIDPIDTATLVYENKTVFDIIKDLLDRAKIENYTIQIEEVEEGESDVTAYTLKKIEFNLGTQYSDAIKQLLEMVNYRIYCDRFGQIRVEKMFSYDKSLSHVVEFNDYLNVTSGSYNLDPSIVRNRIIVQATDGYQAFEDPYLRKYCNNELISSGIDMPWALGEEAKWAVADNYFLGMRRFLHRISLSSKGNPAIDIGDIARVKMLISSVSDNYLILSISTSFTAGGYTDSFELEYLESELKGHLCEKAAGDYVKPKPPEPEPDPDPKPDPEPEPDTGEDGSEKTTGKPVVKTKRDQIVDRALYYQGVWYQWGGDKIANPKSGHFGVDCSHFTYAVLKQFGIQKNYAVSRDQYKLYPTTTYSKLQKGDLVYWGSTAAKIYHVGMYIGDDKVVSACGGGPSTNSLATAKAQNAKIKVHGIRFDGSPRYYSKIL